MAIDAYDVEQIVKDPNATLTECKDLIMALYQENEKLESRGKELVSHYEKLRKALNRFMDGGPIEELKQTWRDN